MPKPLDRFLFLFDPSGRDHGARLVGWAVFVVMEASGLCAFVVGAILIATREIDSTAAFGIAFAGLLVVVLPWLATKTAKVPWLSIILGIAVLLFAVVRASRGRAGDAVIALDAVAVMALAEGLLWPSLRRR